MVEATVYMPVVVLCVQFVDCATLSYNASKMSD